MKTTTSRFSIAVFGLMCMLALGNVFAIGPMKDIELTPEKAGNPSYFMDVSIDPSTGEGTVIFEYDMDADVTLRVFDLAGHEVEVASTGSIKAGRTYAATLDASTTKPGIYYVHLSSASGRKMVKKFMIME